jgi:hypothetical protein
MTTNLINVQEFAKALGVTTACVRRWASKERVSEILHRCSDIVVKNWLARVKQSRELNHLVLMDTDRTGHLPKLIEDLVSRLDRPITGSPVKPPRT